MTAVGAPSCAFLGRDAAGVARRALRRSARGGARVLLVRWDCPPVRSAPSISRPSVRALAEEVAGVVPGDWSVSIDGRVLCIDVPGTAEPSAVLQLVQEHGGPLAVAIGCPRTDGVDAVLRTVDEVVVIEPGVAALQVLVEQELAPVVGRLTIAQPPRPALAALLSGDRGQSTVVVLVLLTLLVAVASALGVVASALGRASDVQGRADVASLAAAKAMLDTQPLLYSADPRRQVSTAEFRRRAVQAAARSAGANGLRVRAIDFVGDDGRPLRDNEALPTRVRVTAVAVGSEREDRLVRSVSEVAVAALTPTSGGGDYSGPLAVRQGQRMRPDVALAFDRMNAAATKAGHPLVITSAYRSDAEQAELFRRNPDPKWVARPGTSLHRLGTELDLGPNAAWGWLAANCGRFGFLKRYPWEYRRFTSGGAAAILGSLPT